MTEELLDFEDRDNYLAQIESMRKKGIVSKSLDPRAVYLCFNQDTYVGAYIKCIDDEGFLSWVWVDEDWNASVHSNSMAVYREVAKTVQQPNVKHYEKRGDTDKWALNSTATLLLNHLVGV